MLIVIHILIQLGLLLRVLLRPNRDPASRIAWAVVVLALPVAGILSYLLLGETNVGKRRRQRLQQVLAGLPDVTAVAGMEAAVRPAIPDHRQCLFDVGRSISGYGPLGGNQGTLMDNTNLAIDRMVEDIDAATHHVHILFYIWLPDRNGTKVAEAVMRAAARGVTCRVMVDDLGSRRLIRSDLWARMGQAGAKLGRTLQIGNPLLDLTCLAADRGLQVVAGAHPGAAGLQYGCDRGQGDVEGSQGADQGQLAIHRRIKEPVAPLTAA